jgi:NAD(P)-dependent dehydrogenase (short-subunit alcohol dehydrogenase family)
VAPSIVITGASAGIGRATAELFLRAGWQVALLARRADELAAIGASHASALVLPCDVTDPAAVDAAFADAARSFGRIDVLFNNAGIFRPAALIDDMSLANWDATIAVNLSGMFYAARAAFRHMRAQDPMGGRIINNGSVSAQAPRPASVGYTVSKHAITGLTKSLALDGRPFNIACGQIDIGNAETALAAKLGQGAMQADGSIRPEPLMDVSHVARTVLHMASLPPDANVLNITLMATNMPLVGRG